MELANCGLKPLESSAKYTFPSLSGFAQVFCHNSENPDTVSHKSYKLMD
jgi:hypothetical protein